MFPGSPPRWLQLCGTRVDAEWQLGSTPQSLDGFSFPPLFVLASRKYTHSTFWRSNECASRAWIKLFCSNLALRQWRRGNMSQLGVDCLNLVQHLQLRCLEDRFLRQKKGKKGTAKAQSLQHLIFHLLAVQTAPDGVHRHRQTTKQLVFAVAATNWTERHNVSSRCQSFQTPSP